MDHSVQNGRDGIYSLWEAISGDRSQGIAALKGTPAGATYSDCVRVNLPDHTLLCISGKTGTKNGELAGRMMREQATQVLLNIADTLREQGGSLADGLDTLRTCIVASVQS